MNRKKVRYDYPRAQKVFFRGLSLKVNRDEDIDGFRVLPCNEYEKNVFCPIVLKKRYFFVYIRAIAENNKELKKKGDF